MGLRNSLYMKNLQELSSLYEQRLVLKRNNLLCWLDFDDMERRMEAHVNELATAGSGVLSLCREQIMEGDAGEYYAAVRIIGKMGGHGMLKDLICQMDMAGDDRVDAFTDALCHESPQGLERDFIQFLLGSDEQRARIAARVISFHRLDYVAELYDSLFEYQDRKPVVIDVIQALGRLRSRYGAERLLSYLYNRDADMVEAAITALVRIGEREALTECMAFIGPCGWSGLSLGLYGGRDDMGDFLFSVTTGEDEEAPVSPDRVIATGLIGNPALLHDLIYWLEVPHLAENAALSLDLITGAGLYEQHAIPDGVCAHDLADHGKMPWKHKTLYPERPYPGKTTERPARNPELWNDWIKKNGRFFSPDVRYRNGRPCSPSGLVDNMKSLKKPDLIRNLASEELVIRYGVDIPFDTRMTVYHQLQAIERCMIRLQGNPDHFTDGLWYYRREPLENQCMGFS